MKKKVSFLLVCIMLLSMLVPVSAQESTEPLSDYEKYYPQFVDSKEPLSTLEQKDWGLYMNAPSVYPELSDIPDENRVDYFDVAYGEDPMQKLDIHHLKKSGNKQRPVIFFIHGGAWMMEDKNNTRYYALEWIKRGYTVVSINYRLSPQATHPSQIEDCAMALKWVIDNIKDYGGNPNKISVIGHSAGAHLAALLVTGKQWHKQYDIDIGKVKCWIPVSGIFDFNLMENYLPPVLAGAMSLMLGNGDKNNVSPINHVTGDEPPCLILHGGDDWLVPRTNSINFYNELVEKGCKNARLEVVPGYWHCNMMLGYDKPDHVPAQLINEYLAEQLPTSENNKGNYKE